MEKTLIPVIVVSSFCVGYLVRSYLFVKDKLNIEDVDLS
tara:strand:- start:3687 stop:3803 length:117 start_codon:yes stop_codon:yes gene_type:complete